MIHESVRDSEQPLSICCPALFARSIQPTCMSTLIPSLSFSLTRIPDIYFFKLQSRLTRDASYIVLRFFCLYIYNKALLKVM